MNKILIAILFLSTCLHTFGETLTGESGQKRVELDEGGLSVDYIIDTQISKNIVVTVEYNLEYSEGYLSLSNYSPATTIQSFNQGIGLYTYTTSNNTGKFKIQFYTGESAVDGSSILISWSVVGEEGKNIYRDYGSLDLRSHSLAPNLYITDKYSMKSMGGGNSYTSDYDQALLLLESSAGGKLGVTTSKISSSGSLTVTANGNLSYSTKSAHTFYTGTESDQTMTIRNDRVGIGTPNPRYGKLEIFGDGLTDGITFYKSGYSTLRIYRTGNYGYITRGGVDTRGIVIDQLGNIGIKTGEKNFSEALFVQGNTQLNGKLTLGNISSSQDLTVYGTINAREVMIEALTADFVFSEDYSLTSLDSVEVFIDTNKHLPGVPSAKDMTENGVGLSQMNQLLLQKVEELTLYMIGLKKENEELSERMSIIEK